MKVNKSVVTTAVVTALSERCGCHSIITQDNFYCPSPISSSSSSSPSSSSGFVTYRARLYGAVNHSASELAQMLHAWRTSNQLSLTFPATGDTLQVNRRCKLLITSLNDTFCSVTSSESMENHDIQVVAASLGTILFVTTMVTSIVTIICCVLCKRYKKQRIER